jgi:hypothetical protein
LRPSILVYSYIYHVQSFYRSPCLSDTIHTCFVIRLGSAKCEFYHYWERRLTRAFRGICFQRRAKCSAFFRPSSLLLLLRVCIAVLFSCVISLSLL